MRSVSLRSGPIEREVSLPDGQTLLVRVGIAPDPYVPRRDLSTVVLELVADDDRVQATVNTVLRPDQDSEARKLVGEVTAKLESGELAPTAAALEPLADSIA
jgi:hypothetical protein